LELSGESKLSKLGYKFVDNKLLQNDDSPFKFLGQQHYEEVGDAVATYIEELLIKEGLEAVDLSKFANSTPGRLTEKPVIYSSPGVWAQDKQQQSEKSLILLIQGSGAVRAGQWARSLCINDSLCSGSQLNYIRRIKKMGWDVIVFNPNQPHTYQGPVSQRVVKNVEFVWERLQESKHQYKDIAIIAHSYGAHHTLNLLDNYPQVREKVKGIAFTDGVYQKASKQNAEILKRIGMNWVTSA